MENPKLKFQYYAVEALAWFFFWMLIYFIFQISCGGLQWWSVLGAMCSFLGFLGVYMRHHLDGHNVEEAYLHEFNELKTRLETEIAELKEKLNQAIFNIVSPKNDQKLTFVVPYLRTSHPGKSSNISIGLRVGKGMLEGEMKEICQLILGPADPTAFTTKFPAYQGPSTKGLSIRHRLLLTKLAHQTHSYVWQGRWIDVIAVEVFGAVTSGSIDAALINTQVPGGTDLSGFQPLGETDQAIIDCTYFSPDVAKSKVNDPLSLLIIERLEREHRP